MCASCAAAWLVSSTRVWGEGWCPPPLASLVLECLKVLLLLHSVVEKEEEQVAVLAILLPSAIAAASAVPVRGWEGMGGGDGGCEWY